jgi:hypothetical protein
MYSWIRNDGLTIGTSYVYRCIYCTSYKGVAFTSEEEHLGRWSTQRREREIDTKIASNLKWHSWYRNTLMAAEISEMNDNWGLDPIRKGFYKLL